MGLRPTTPEDVEGHAFVVHRARNAISGQDIAARNDSLRTQTRSLQIGIGLGAVVLAAAAVLTFIRPAPQMETVQLAQVNETGGLFVQVDGVFHAVPNLVSARLVLGAPVTPQRVPQRALAGLPRGPLLGIPGAPNVVPDDDISAETTWTVCDAPLPGQAEPATVMLSSPGLAAPVDAWPAADGVLVNRDGQGWLLADGRRVRVDLTDTAVLEVFGLQNWPQQQVSDALLELLPEGAPLGRVDIPGQGAVAPFGPAGMRVGEVFAVETTEARKHFVVLSEGIQEISPMVAELLRATGESRDDVSVPVLAPSQVTAPRVSAIDVSAVPVRLPRRARASGPVLCAYWQGDTAQDGKPVTGLRSAARISELAPAPIVQLAGADGDGPAVDGVSLPVGGLPVRPVGVGSTKPVGEERAWVGDTGSRFSLDGQDVPAMVGLPSVEVPIPVSLLRALPAGPELSVANARVQYDAPHINNDPLAAELSAGPGPAPGQMVGAHNGGR